MGLAPWCQNEKWTYGAEPGGRKWARVEGRERCPSNLKLNPLWWIQNTYEQQFSEAPWFEPEKPQATRERDWLLRNPFQNANLFVFGVADRNYTVTVVHGFPDPMVVQRDDVVPPQKGFQRARLTLDDGSTRMWTSYVGDWISWSWGCQPTGLFEIKLNFHFGRMK